MKRFFAFVKKEFYHILRDPRTLLILLGMPIIMVVLFGFAINNEIKNAKLAIFDQSDDAATRSITNKLVNSGYFRIEKRLLHRNQIEESFQEGEIKMVVVFEGDFQRALESGKPAHIQLITDATNPNTANTLISYFSNIVRSYQREESHRIRKVPIIITEPRLLFNPELESAFYFVPGVITIILMLVSAMMTSITIAREKEYGNMEILLVSPLQPIVIILGKTIPYILLAFLNAATIILIGYLVFDMPLPGNYFLLIMEILIFILTSLSLGILISTIADDQQTALLISMMGLMLPTILLSGFIFPIESMPEFLQLISNLIPAKWFIIIIKDIMLKGSGFSVVWDESLVLVVMSMVLVGLSIRRFNIRLE